MKRLLSVLVLLTIMVSACNKVVPLKATSLEFIGGDITLMMGQNAKLSLKINYADGSSQYCLFDGSSSDVSLSSRDEAVATVTSAGVVVPVSVGSTIIDAVFEGIQASVNVFVSAPDGEAPLPDPKKTFSSNAVYLNVNNNRGMQVFEMLDDGSIIISVSLGEAQEQYFERILRNGTILPAMHMTRGDHGDSMSVEQGNGKTYIWFSCFSSKWYEGPQLLVRSEFIQGSSYEPESFSDLYYYGNKGQGFVSVDDKHDLLALLNQNQVTVYRLSQAKEAPLKEVKLARKVTNGTNISFSRKAHDLTALRPIASFALSSEEYQGYFNGKLRPMQGFCVYKDRIYFHLGVEDVAVTVLDLYGNYIMRHVKMAVNDDKESLIRYGVLDPQYNFEPEGIQIQNGHVYLGFTPYWNKVLVLEM